MQLLDILQTWKGLQNLFPVNDTLASGEVYVELLDITHSSDEVVHVSGAVVRQLGLLEVENDRLPGDVGSDVG